MSAAEAYVPGAYDAIRDFLASFNPLAVTSAIGGLQAVQANAHSLGRLSSVATLACEHPVVDHSERLTGADLNTILNGGPLAGSAALHEDPLDCPFTEEIAFYGGSYLVGGGLGEDAAYVFRQLARGCFVPDRLPRQLASELIGCGVAALALSDSALRAAGLVANLEPGMRTGKVEIPEQARLIELQKAMAFDRRRLASLFPETGLRALDPLIIDTGERSFSDQEIVEGSADSRPILRAGDWLVLARPFDVLVALRQHISMRVSAECGPELTESLFGSAVDRDVVASLRRMRLSPETKVERGGEQLYTEIRAHLDIDKTLACLVLCDDFKGLSDASPYTIWDGTALAEVLDQRLKEIAEEVAAKGEQALALVLMQPAGRQGLLAVPKRNEGEMVILSMAAANLDVIAVLEEGDPLALWKFAQAENCLRERARVMTTSMLDVYGAYRDGERSFGNTRDADSVTFPPGFAGPYRCQAIAGRNRHGAIGVGGKVREVERREIDPARGEGDRLYYETDIQAPRLSIHITGVTTSIWVDGPANQVERTADAVESVAYWMGELCEPLGEFFERLGKATRAISIEVDFEPWGYWFEGAPDPGGEDPGSITVVNHQTVRVTFGPEVRRRLPQADNAAEREIVELLLGALDQLAEIVGCERLDLESRKLARDAVAPLGVKKHLIMLPAEINPMVEEPDGPVRLVPEADRSAVRYALAERLEANFGYRDEEIPHERRNDVLKAAVADLFAMACATVDAVSPDGLLESLITMNERLIAASEHRRAILPARLATYPEAAQTLRQDVSEANLAAICCRFLIEYATASPPSGTAQWSLAAHDEAQAAVAEMLDWADLSDAVFGKLSEVDLLVREDGLLRLAESDRYDSGRSRFFDRHIASDRRRSEERWAGRFEKQGEGESELIKRIDELMVDEAGVSLIRLGETLMAANHLARDRNEELVVMSRIEAVKQLAEMLDRPSGEIEKAVNYLAMGSRPDFMTPPDGDKTDVYPWRYARRWSYNRRPFLVRSENGQDELLWGRRHVVGAFNIFFGQLESGRYQHLASSRPLRQELGRMADESGAAFESRVAEIFGDLGWIVERGVKRIGGEKLQRSSAEDLGDIDVLTADVTSKTLWVVECKALTGSLSSSEVVLEMTDHFRQEGVTSVTKHAERVAWVEERLEAALAQLGVVDEEEWKLRGLIVTGRDVLAPYIDDLPFDLVAVDDLGEYVRVQRGL